MESASLETRPSLECSCLLSARGSLLVMRVDDSNPRSKQQCAKIEDVDLSKDQHMRVVKRQEEPLDYRLHKKTQRVIQNVTQRLGVEFKTQRGSSLS